MRLAGHTYAFRELALEQALDEIQALGLDAVEVWLGHVPGEPAAAARELERRGLDAAAVSAGGFHPADPSAPGRAYALADALATPIVVATVSPVVLDTVAGAVPGGLTLCLENHWDQVYAGPDDVLGALAGHPRLVACLDTGHAIMAGRRADRFAERLGGRLAHLHLKDAYRPHLHERLLSRRLRRRLLARPPAAYPGEGALDVAKLRQTLGSLGFDGTLALEYEGGAARAPSALGELLRAWTAD
jgi:sugar phosphate isomerase/epimerase